MVKNFKKNIYVGKNRLCFYFYSIENTALYYKLY